MEKRWIESLRNRFADRQTAPPDGLWEGIEAALREKGVAAPAPRRTRVLMLWRAAAVAACAVLLAGMGWMFISRDGSDDGRIVRPLSYNAPSDGGHDTAPAAAAVKEFVAQAKTGIRRVAVAVSEGDTLAAAVEPAAESGADIAGDVVEKEQAGKRESVVVTRRGDRGGSYSKADGLLAEAVTSRDSRGGVAVSVYGTGLSLFGNSTGSSGAALSPFNMVRDIPVGKDFRMLAMAYVGDENGNEAGNEVRVNHRQPVKVGASVRFGLSDRFGIETGLNYSYHSADIASGDDEGGYKTEQKLHFIGVPLNLSYRIWGTDYLDIYASAGGAVEFCVSGNSHTEYVSGNEVVSTVDSDVRDKRPQWSVNASAGVQYNFNDILGIYLEPGVSYYFDNGSDVATIYKDKPFNFNLNVGVRFTVK